MQHQNVSQQLIVEKRRPSPCPLPKKGEGSRTRHSSMVDARVLRPPSFDGFRSPLPSQEGGRERVRVRVFVQHQNVSQQLIVEKRRPSPCPRPLEGEGSRTHHLSVNDPLAKPLRRPRSVESKRPRVRHDPPPLHRIRALKTWIDVTIRLFLNMLLLIQRHPDRTRRARNGCERATSDARAEVTAACVLFPLHPHKSRRARVRYRYAQTDPGVRARHRCARRRDRGAFRAGPFQWYRPQVADVRAAMRERARSSGRRTAR